MIRYNNNTCTVAHATNPVTLTVPNAPVITNVASTDPTDCSVTDGTITITATSGTGSIEYSIDGGTNWQVSNLFQNLDASDNPYEIRVRNSNGTCIVIGQTINLTDPVAPTISNVTFSNPTDCGVSNGTITITATSTAGNAIEYSINGGTTYQSSNVFTGLDASGNPYEIRVRNVGGTCVINSTDITLTDKITPTYTSVTPVNPSNCNTNDGTITIVATDGSGTLEYSIDGGVNYQSSASFTGLGAGTYNVFIRYNDNTCTVAYPSNPVILTVPNAATITDVTHTDITDCSLTDGTITITATGGTAPLEYSIDSGTTYLSNGGTFTSVSAGTYYVFVRNNGGTCIVVGQSVVIDDKVAPIISNVLSTNPSDCGVADGTITISANSSIGNAIEYSINGGATYQSSNVFSGLDASGNAYEIRVRNADGTCVVSNADVNLIDKVQPAITNITTTNPSNCGVNDGTITITATGVSLEYSIDGGTNWQASNSFTTLAAGTYNLFVRNVDGSCNTPYPSNPVILTAPNAPSITNVSQTDPTDCGNTNGTITITASGGVGALQYSIDSGSTYFTNSGAFSGLAGGTYKILVSNNDGSCVVSFPDVTLTDKIAPVIATISNTDPTDCGVTDGTITITASSGQGSIEYSINAGASWQPSNVFTGLNGGTYDVRVRNIDATCEVTGTAQVLTNKVQPVISSVAPTDPSNCGVNNGSIAIVATGASTEYSIDGGLNWQASGTFGSLAAGSYNIAVRNSDETCFDLYTSNPIILNAPNAPSITNISFTDPTDCSVTDGTITITATGGLGNYEYSIDSGSTWTNTTGSFTGLTGGAYGIRVRNNDGTCEVLGQLTVLTDKVAPSITNVSFSNPTECGIADGTITILANSSIGNALQYSINGGATYQASNVFSGLDASGNAYEIRVRNADGTCVESSANVNLTDKIQPVISTVQSNDPTNCGVNDGTITITASGASTEYSIDGGTNWQATGLFTGLNSGTYNIAVRNTDETCFALYTSNPVTLNAPNSPSITNISTTDPTDCSVTDGTITIAATGGTGSYEYSIDSGTTYQAGSLFAGLSGGTYTIFVRNSDNTCEVYGQQVTLTDKISPVITTVATTNPTDCGVIDGTITITASSGQGSIEYSIDEGTTWQPSNVFTGLTAGTYEIRVRNIDGTCLTSAPDEVLVAPIQPNITNVTSANPTNCNSNDGTITVTATGASTEYSIDGGLNWQNSGSFTGLTAGTYNVSVRNSDGTCENLYISNPVVLTVPAAPSITNISSTDPTNCSLTDGTITVAATGGSGSYEYSIDSGSTWTNVTGAFTNLAGGTYQIRVRNAADNSCEIVGQTVVLTDKVAPTITNVTFSDPTDCGVADGTITITASSSAGNSIQYSIDGGATWDGSGAFTGLDASGNPYEIRVRNVDGTCVVSSTNINLTNKVLPVINTVTTTDPSNCGQNDGQIVINATGASLEYSIDAGANWQVSSSFSGLGAGTYNINVRNTDGTCTIVHNSNPVILTAPNAPSITNVSFTDPTDCAVTDGTITITAISGSGSYEYSIDSGTTYLNGNVFTNLSGGEYCIFVRNADGTCVVNGQCVTLTDKVAPTISNVTFTNETDCGQADGTITITATSTAGNAIEYSIDDGATYQTSNVFSGLDASSNPYEIRVRNVGGTCVVSSGDVNLTDKIQPIISSVATVDPSNCGVNDGTITITATGASLEYSIDGGINWNSTGVFNTLGAGNYNIFVRNGDASCLTAHASNPVSLTAPNAPSIANVISTDPTDCSVIDGTITITATGGSGSYEYSIDSGTTWQGANVFNALAGNTYYVFVRNSDATCVVYGQSVVLTDKVAPSITSTSFTDPTDCGQADGTITVIANSTAGNALQFSIDGGATYQASNVFGGLNGGTYAIRVRNVDGTCMVNSSVTLTDKVQPVIASVNPTNPSNCDVNDGQIVINAAGVSLEYSIDAGANWQISNTFPNLGAGTYNIFVRNTDGSCTTTHTSNPVILTIPSAPSVTNVAFTDPTDCSVTDGAITITAIGGSGIYQYSIDSGTTYQNANVFTGLAGGEYCIFVRNQDGTCIVTGQCVTLTDKVAPIISTVANTNPTDCSLADGTITITASSSIGNSLEFSIDGGANWQVSNVFSGLSGGLYQIRVRNADGTCEVSNPNITLIDKVAPSNISVAAVNSTNCGADNGSITVTAIGASLEYSIDGGLNWTNSNAFNGLGAGTYNVFIRNTDESCLTAYVNNPVIITAPNAPSFTNVAFTQPSNCGVNDGTITITATGGSGIYQYSIDNGTTWTNTTGAFTGLAGDIYQLMVRNQDGTCEVTGQVVVLTDKIAPIINSVASGNPSDCGVSDGTITITATSPNGSPIQYSIDGGGIWDGSGTFTGLSGGTYQIRVRNADGSCIVTETDVILIDKVQPVITNVATIDPSNCGVNNGSITITATGVSVEYSIDGGTNWQVSNAFSGLGAGTYNVFVRNTDGSCNTPHNSNPVILTAPNAPSITNVASTDPTDCSLTDGSITISATGGTGNYEYSIDSGTTYQTSNVFNGLTGSTSPYYIFVRNNDGTCAVYGQQVTLTDKVAPVISNVASSSPSDCSVADGTITISASSSIGNSLEFSIDGGASWQISNVISALSGGTYQIRVRNADANL